MAHQVAERGAEQGGSERLAYATLDAQKQSLEMLVSGSPLGEVLTYLARVVERLSEGQVVASILLLDEQGRLRNGASPGLPDDYVDAIDGIRADPEVGTCAAAAARGAVVITPDIAADPGWRGLEHLPLGLGFRAAWSMPIFARDGRVLGTFGTYFRERRKPEKLERQVVEVLSRTAALAIERGQAERRLARSEAHLRAIFEASRDGILVESDERTVYVNEAYARLFEYDSTEELIGVHVSAIVAPDDRERLLEYGRLRLRGEPAPTAYEFKGRRRDGSLVDLGASVSTHTIEGGTFITTLVRDISDRKRADEALQRSEAEYRLLLEHASDGIHTYDLSGRILDTNSKFCEMLGYTREELLRLNVADLIPPEDLAAAPIRFDELRAGETILTERRLLRKDGKLLPGEISGSMVNGGVLLSIVRDISERKRAEESLHWAYDELERRVEERTAQLARANETLKDEVAERLRAEETLRESEQRLKIALQTGNLGSWQLDLATFELDSSATCKANFGQPEGAEFTYQDLFEAIHPEDRVCVRAAIERAVGGHADYQAEYRAVWPDGSIHWIVAHGRGIYAPGGEPLRMVGVTIDITERRQAEEARRELLGRLVTAQEEERRRISRELHDRMGQQLAALLMGLKTLGASSYGRRSALDTLRQLEGITDELSREVHTLAWGLRPPALDDLGLEAALCNYVEEWAERARVPVDFHSSGFGDGRLPLTHETAVYRIAQEALTNVARHAGADRVSFILERRGDHVLAVIEDNGGGFDVEAALSPTCRGRRLGLLGMRERAALLGGTINVESAPGAGTTLFVRIPFVAGGAGAGGRRG